MTLLDFAMFGSLLLVCGLALLRGAVPERLTAIALLIVFAVNSVPLARSLITEEPIVFFSAEATLAIDILLLAALGAVAVTSRPTWTLFAAAFQLLATLISFVNLTDEGLSSLAYLTAQNTLWWLTLVALAWGAATARPVRTPAGGPARLRPTDAAGAGKP
jgi:hypothetical protein